MEQISRETARVLLAKARPSKYRARGHYDADGIWWASEREEKVWHELLIREANDEIRDLRRQVRYGLHAAPAAFSSIKLRVKVAEIVVDFVFYEKSKLRTLDAKGFATPLFKLKKKLFEGQYNLKLEIC
jgi:Protein of unknown function (DUF1064)